MLGVVVVEDGSKDCIDGCRCNTQFNWIAHSPIHSLSILQAGWLHGQTGRQHLARQA